MSSRLCALAFNCLLPLIILLVGAGLRFHALAGDRRFHPDEAWFATFARAAALNGDWLLPGALDKPPLSIYAGALVMTAFAADSPATGLPDVSARLGEFAARVPAIFASILLTALLYALVKRLYRDESPGARRLTALLAMGLLALSPFAVSYSATAFTDGLMLMWMVAALWAVAAGRWGTSGVCLALGFASKQQALFYLPLVVMLGWAVDGLDARRLLRLALPLLAGAALLLAWDAARAQPAGFWALAAANNDPWRLLRSDELAPRLSAWLAHGEELFGTAWLTAILTLAGGAAALWRIIVQPRRRETVADALLLTYALAYALLHWLTAFNTYDRYLLPLLPVIVVLAARALALPLTQGRVDTAHRRKSAKTQWHYFPASLRLCASVLCFFLFVLSWQGDRTRFDADQYEGMDALADDLNRRGLGAIVYDHWLGWELDYYLGQWTDKRRVYYPTPDALAADARLQPDPAPRYFIAPADEPVRRWLDALRDAGFAVTLSDQSPNFVVYELIPPCGGA